MDPKGFKVKASLIVLLMVVQLMSHFQRYLLPRKVLYMITRRGCSSFKGIQKCVEQLVRKFCTMLLSTCNAFLHCAFEHTQDLAWPDTKWRTNSPNSQNNSPSWMVLKKSPMMFLMFLPCRLCIVPDTVCHCFCDCLKAEVLTSGCRVLQTRVHFFTGIVYYWSQALPR